MEEEEVLDECSRIMEGKQEEEEELLDECSRIMEGKQEEEEELDECSRIMEEKEEEEELIECSKIMEDLLSADVKLNRAEHLINDLETKLALLKCQEIFKNDKNVVLFGMKNIELEGKRASIIGYAGDNMVTVLVAPVGCIVVDENCVCGDDDTTTISTNTTTTNNNTTTTNNNKSENKKIALRPGNVFYGSICIPGMTTSATRASYKLWILKDGRILQHEAYGDTQYCHVRVKPDVIEYVDAETQCRITNIDVKDSNNITLNGYVSQLKHPRGLEAEGEAVFQYKEDKITHTLELHLTLLSSHDKYRSISFQLQEARDMYLQYFDEWTECVEKYCAQFAAELQLEALSEIHQPPCSSWAEIYSQACARCEMLCCIIRRKAEDMAELTFSSKTHKNEFLEGLYV